MSIHPSLASAQKHKKQRSVLKRIERIRHMIEKGTWKEGDKVYGLPKIKTVRIKIKKEKVEKAVEGAPVEGAAPAAAEAQAPETKEQTAKASSAPRGQEKK